VIRIAEDLALALFKTNGSMRSARKVLCIVIVVSSHPKLRCKYLVLLLPIIQSTVMHDCCYATCFTGNNFNLRSQNVCDAVGFTRYNPKKMCGLIGLFTP
jgi:hypothetical protein